MPSRTNTQVQNVSAIKNRKSRIIRNYNILEIFCLSTGLNNKNKEVLCSNLVYFWSNTVQFNFINIQETKDKQMRKF